MAIPKFLNYKKILEKKDFLPFYVYDFNLIKRQILKLKKNIPKNVKVFYVAKANPNIAILRVMKKFGLGVVVMSLGEFFAAKKGGFKPADVFFAGSTKSDQEFLEAIRNGVNSFGLESISEIQRLNKIAKRVGKKEKVLLRLDLTGYKKQITKKYKVVSSFGILLNDFNKLIYDFPKKFSNLDLRGIHIYGSNRVYDVDILIENIEHIFSVIQKFEKKNKLNFKIINIGGGFGASAKQELEVVDFCKKLEALLKKYNFKDREIILELGRYLVNQAGAYVTRVIELKKINKVNFLVVEGFINHLIRVLADSEAKNQFLFAKDRIVDYEIKILPKPKSQFYPTVIRGQMSSQADSFGRSFNCKFYLPEAKAGNFLIIKGVGAYGLTQAVVLFGNRAFPAEFIIISNKLELIRHKVRPKDFFPYQRIPSILNK